MPYRGLVYNADNGRPIEGPADTAQLIRKHRVDIALVLEAGGYGPAVDDLLPDHRVFSGPDALIVVRRGIPARRMRVHDLRTGGWERAPENEGQGLHPGRAMPSLRIGGGDRGPAFKVAALHLPPPPHDDPKNYPLRGKATGIALDRVARITTRWDRWLIGGDWNKLRGASEMRAWLNRVDAKAQGGGVDYPAVHGLRLANVRQVPAGGDHGNAARFDVHV